MGDYSTFMPIDPPEGVDGTSWADLVNNTGKGNFYSGEYSGHAPKIPSEGFLNETDPNALEPSPRTKTVEWNQLRSVSRRVVGLPEEYLWQGHTDTFAPTDIDLYLIVPSTNIANKFDVDSPNVMHVTTVSRFAINSFRATPFARPIGYVNPKGYGRATRTVAGSLGAHITQRDFLYRVINYLDSIDKPSNENSYYTLDQLPPLDFLVMYANEYGASAFRIVRGVIFTSEGSMIGIGHTDNAFVDNDFIAIDYTPIIPMGSVEPNNVENNAMSVRVPDDTYFQRVHGTKGFSNLYYGDMWNKEENYKSIFANTNDYLY